MVLRVRFRQHRRAAARRPVTLLLGAVLAAEIVVWTGVATNWFGVIPAGGSSPKGTPEPNPNPYNETVRKVVAAVNYTGNLSGYFPALQGLDICGHCPAVPFNDTAFSPPVAGFWFYFNVTNTASYYESISNFTVTTSGANPNLFLPGYAKCCYPGFLSFVAQVGFVPGQTFGLEAFVHAAFLPNVGPSGFTLYFNVTSA
jgi:hypothetical protein